MSLGLEFLFEVECLDAAPESCHTSVSQGIVSPTTLCGPEGSSSCDTRTHDAADMRARPEEHCEDNLDGLDETMDGLQLSVTNMMSGTMLIEEAMEELRKERDKWEAQAKEYAKENETLRKRLIARASEDPAFPSDVVTRLNRLEPENQRLRTENNALKKELDTAEREYATLCYENEGKGRKLKGANKKVRNAKNVAAQEEEKAKEAVHDKNQRLASERKMRKERNEALAELEKLKKQCAGLRADLLIERSGDAHLRDDGTVGDETTVAIPIEFKIHRGDFHKLRTMFQSNQMIVRDKLERWYREWRKPEEEGRTKVVGANYVDAKNNIGVDLYDDEVTVPEELGGEYPRTGAEHDEWRSKRGLEAVCRQATATDNALQ